MSMLYSNGDGCCRLQSNKLNKQISAIRSVNYPIKRLLRIFVWLKLPKQIQPIFLKIRKYQTAGQQLSSWENLPFFIQWRSLILPHHRGKWAGKKCYPKPYPNHDFFYKIWIFVSKMNLFWLILLVRVLRYDFSKIVTPTQISKLGIFMY